MPCQLVPCDLLQIILSAFKVTDEAIYNGQACSRQLEWLFLLCSSGMPILVTDRVLYLGRFPPREVQHVGC